MSHIKTGTALKAVMLATTALAAGVAGAQEGDDDSEQREEVVTVYGTSNAIPVFDYPGQVTVFDRNEIEALAPSAISNLLRDVPGVEFTGGPRRTGELPSIRGLSGQNVLILLDGARQSFTSAHDGRFFIDPDLLGSAEVVKGPASALYGSGAVGGVLAFESVDAADLLADDQTWGARIHIGYQSVNEETIASLTGFTQMGAFDGVANFGVRQSGDIALGSGFDLPSDDDIQNALLKGGYQITNALRIEGSWQRFENTAIEPNNGQGTAGTGDALLDRDVEKDITSDTFRLGVDYDPANNPWIDASLVVYSTQSDVDEFDNTIPRTTLREIETTGFTVRNASRFDLGPVRTTLTIGGDWYKDEQTGTDDQTTDGTRGGVPNGESEFTGVFAQIEAEIDRPFGLPGELLLIPGVRYDEFESSSSIAPGQTNEDDAVSPRIAASYGPTNWLRVFGNYSEGFRAPSINELYLDGVHFSLPHPVLFNPMMGSFVFVNNNFIPNPLLTPETTETIEFGVGFDFEDVITANDLLQAKVSYFESDVEDLIDLSVNTTFDPTCFAPPFFQPCTAGTSESANIDNAKFEGFEAELQYDAPRAAVKATYATIEGEDLTDGSDTGSLTPDRFTLDAAIKAPEWNARFGVRWQVANEFRRREVVGGTLAVVETRDDYSILDLYATWRPDFLPGVRVDAGVDNIFDEDYERVFAGVSEPGRNFKISASWQFGQ